ncbi:MAG: RNA polymerase sigma-70 factor [Bacteroidales bacterium]|nr:RNA polymerase sigma-70 factor [Bacteroidales bacterium]
MTSREIERLEAIKKGDIQEFELLFREFYQPLLNYAMAIIKSEPDAEEVVQDIFFVLWKNKKSLTIHSSISAYLYKAVQNNCLQLIRYQKRKLNYQQDRQIENEYESLSPGEVLQYNELYNEINRIVDELPENCKTIFMLNRFHGLKNSEIAEKLAISIKTVEANMTKALKYLKQHINNYAAN